MLSTAVYGLACLATVASASPFSFPLSNSFPKVANPSDTLTNIELLAQGSLPNGGPPPTPASDSLTSLSFIAFNELLEVAFFTQLLSNITTNVTGYAIDDPAICEEIVTILTAVQAQEELHALNANGAVTKFAGKPIEPCEYVFPVTDFESAIALASTFTDVVLGTLQDVVTRFGGAGDVALIGGVASVIGQEGEQNGVYRLLGGKIPSSLPFLTASTREFAFSALLQNFVVPNSCGNLGAIELHSFEPLTVFEGTPEPVEQYIDFSIETTDTYSNGGSDYSGLSMVYINQQNVPVVESIQNITVDGNIVSFTAWFPFNGTTFGNGLTIAALTNSTGPFKNAGDVTAATLFGPGLIEIN